MTDGLSCRPGFIFLPDVWRMSSKKITSSQQKLTKKHDNSPSEGEQQGHIICKWMEADGR